MNTASKLLLPSYSGKEADDDLVYMRNLLSHRKRQQSKDIRVR